ncbi:MAG: hypothetical protein E7004_06605 [Alphaproteobacteria bacterium]|nr:hypothetical protein [Alphaproteobacteria bacterium]
MRNIKLRRTLQKGSLMIEALALLGLISMVTPVMYKKAAERTTELQDINLATQMRTLNGALDEYVRNNISSLKANPNTTVGTGVEVSSANVLSFLPVGFNIDGMKYFDKDKMKFKVKQKVVNIGGVNHSTFTTAVIAPSLAPVSRTRAAKIASMIGVNGGIYDTKAAEGGNDIIGTQGAWSAKLSDWHTLGADETLHEGTLMTISSEAITGSAPVDSSKVLYRVFDDDPLKNTMATNLIMGNNDITDVKEIKGATATFTGDVTGNKLVAGDGGLDVAGVSKLKGTFINGYDEAAGFTLGVIGKTDLNGTLDVRDATKLYSTLEVDGKTTLNDALDVSLLSKLKGGAVIGDGEQEDSNILTVRGASYLDGELTVADGKKTTLGGELEVKGNTTIGASGGTENILTVNGSATVTKDLTIGGALDANSLHAREKLSAGGTDYASSAFKSESSETSVTYGNIKFNVNHGSITQQFQNNKATLGASGYRVELKDTDDNAYALLNMAESGVTLGRADEKVVFGKKSAKLTNNYTSLMLGGGTVGTEKRFFAKIGGENIIEANGDSKYTTISSPVDGNKASKITLNKDNVRLEKYTSGASADALILLDANDNFRLDTNDMIVDEHGMAIGENLTGGSGADGSDYIRKKTASGFSYNTTEREGGEERAVVISRKGYIDIAPPTDNFDATATDAADGHSMGFIRARRLVSDIPYINDVDGNFHGMDVNGNELTADGKYDYYQVNPAYTSVMNDIKLASRGGARLSDILPDFVIKGIYVADNTYYGGTSGVSGLAKYDDGDCKGEYKHKCWDRYKIEYGSVVLHKDSGSDKVGPIECEKADCVTTPWLGYIPVPHCPKNYQMSITFNPIRWRMSEVYNLTGSTTKVEGAGYLNDSTITTDEDLIEYVTDSGTGYDFEDDGEDARFHHKFRKLTNPNDFIGVEEAAAPTDGSPHDHTLTQNPVTLQTNTWLNSTVLANYKDYTGNEQNQVFGWHMLMGFLYRPGDFEKVYAGDKTLIDLLSPPETGKSYSNDDLFFNIFPVYAQELAGIATVYCSFNRHPLNDVGSGRDNPWKAGEVGSPVIDYNQLDSALYREGYNRNPAGSTTGGGTNWNKAVNDPTLRYNDAW